MLLMLIHYQKRWVVITPPKTGSNSLNRLLTTPQFGGLPYFQGWHHNTEQPAEAADYQVYLSVRDPYARASSFYRFHLRDPWIREPWTPFSRFVQAVLLDRAASEFYWRSLTEWRPEPCHVIRLEHLAQDLEQLQPAGRYLIPLENADPGLEHWQAAYDRDPDAWPLVAEWARADCERFNYVWSAAGP